MNNYNYLTYLEEAFNSNRLIKHYEILIRRILAFLIDCSTSLAIVQLLCCMFDREGKMLSFPIAIMYYSQCFIVHLLGFKNTFGGRALNLSYVFINDIENTAFRRLYRFLVFISLTFPAWGGLYLIVSLFEFNNTINSITSSIPLLLFCFWWLIRTLFNGGKQTCYDKMANVYVIYDKE